MELPYISRVEGDNIEILKGEGEYFVNWANKEEEFKVTHKLEIPFEKPEISEILTVNILSYDNSCNIKASELVMRSVVKAKILYLSTKGKFCTEEIEFGNDDIDSIKLDDPSKENRILLKTNLKDVSSEAMEDSDGEKRIIRIEVKFNALYSIYNKEKANFVKDMYHMEKDLKLKHSQINLIKDINTIQKNFMVRGNFEGINESQEIFFNGAIVVFDHVLEDGNMIIVSGVVKINSIVITQEGHDTEGVRYFEIPFSETLTGDKDIDIQDCKMKIEVMAQDFMYSETNDSRIELEVKMNVNIHVLSMENITVVEDAEEGQCISTEQKDHTLIRLYYTAPEDTGWSICKKFRVNRDELKGVNEGLDFDKLEVGKMLVIP
jgi:hypothetical protein